MKIRYLLFIFSFSVTYQLFSQLSGIYTIGGTNPDFASLNSASQALSSQGVSGNVIFNIRTGIYNTTSSISYIPNACYVYQVIFQSESGNPDDVIFTNYGNADDYATIKMYLANFVTIRNITIEINDNGSYCKGSSIMALNCYNCTLSNCIIKGGSPLHASYDYNAAVRVKHSWYEPETSFTIKDCKIITKGYGIYFSGEKGKTYIINNIIQSDLSPSVTALWTEYCELTGNHINKSLYNNWSYNWIVKNNYINGNVKIDGGGLDMQNNVINGVPYMSESYSSITSGTPQIINNTFNSRLEISTIYYSRIYDNKFKKLYLSYCCYLKFQRNEVDTMHLSFSSNSQIIGNRFFNFFSIGLDNSDEINNDNLLINNFICGEFDIGLHEYWYIYNNNFNITYFDIQMVAHMQIKNNIIKIPYYIEFNIYNSAYDYNNYYPAGGGNELHHFNIDPCYVSATDLHIQNGALKGLVPWVIFSDDIDGDDRGPLSTVGADEICLPDVFSAGVDLSIKCGDSVSLSPTYNHTATYIWQPSSGLSDTLSARPKASPDTTTTYYVTATDSCASHTDSVKVFVTPFVVDAGLNFLFTCGIPHQLTATYNPNAHYQWTPSEGLSNDTIYNPYALPLDTVTYIVSTYIQNCGTSTDSVTLFLKPYPVAAFTCTVYSNKVTFDNESTFPAYYYWDFGDGSHSTELNPIHSYHNPGYYTVTLYVSTPCGTEKSYSKVIAYNVSVNEIENDSLFICSPNPFSDFINIHINSTSTNEITVSLLNITGEEISVLYKGHNSGDITINHNLGNLKKGIYLIKLSDGCFSAYRKLIHTK